MYGDERQMLDLPKRNLLCVSPSAQMDLTFLCETARRETSHTAKSWAIASGPVGYVDRMLDKMGTMLYSLTLK